MARGSYYLIEVLLAHSLSWSLSLLLHPCTGGSASHALGLVARHLCGRFQPQPTVRQSFALLPTLSRSREQNPIQVHTTPGTEIATAGDENAGRNDSVLGGVK
jgi:hypothetical protein